MVLRTVGPQTIGRYLGFAIGDGVGEEEWDGQHHEGARDLEGIGRPIRRKEEHIIEEIDESSDAGHPRIPIPSAHRGSADSDIKVDDDDSKVGGSAPTVTVTRSISGASNATLRGLSLSQLGLQDDRSSAEILLPTSTALRPTRSEKPASAGWQDGASTSLMWNWPVLRVTSRASASGRTADCLPALCER